jgi:hypothetical protein
VSPVQLYKYTITLKKKQMNDILKLFKTPVETEDVKVAELDPEVKKEIEKQAKNDLKVYGRPRQR